MGNTLSIVIPVYNARAWLPELWSRLEAAAGEASEWIFVDDGSEDTTLDLLKELALADHRIHVVSWPRPLGLTVALREGVRAARGNFIVTLDDDLEHPPEEIPRLVHKLKRGADLVYGVPLSHPRTFWRNAARFVSHHIFLWLTGHPLPRPFRAFRKELVPDDAPMDALLDFVLLGRTKNCVQVQVEYHRSCRPRSTHTFLGLVKLFLTGVRQLSIVRNRA